MPTKVERSCSATNASHRSTSHGHHQLDGSSTNTDSHAAARSALHMHHKEALRLALGSILAPKRSSTPLSRSPSGSATPAEGLPHPSHAHPHAHTHPPHAPHLHHSHHPSHSSHPTRFSRSELAPSATAPSTPSTPQSQSHPQTHPHTPPLPHALPHSLSPSLPHSLPLTPSHPHPLTPPHHLPYLHTGPTTPSHSHPPSNAGTPPPPKTTYAIGATTSSHTSSAEEGSLSPVLGPAGPVIASIPEEQPLQMLPPVVAAGSKGAIENHEVKEVTGSDPVQPVHPHHDHLPAVAAATRARPVTTGHEVGGGHGYGHHHEKGEMGESEGMPAHRAGFIQTLQSKNSAWDALIHGSFS